MVDYTVYHFDDAALQSLEEWCHGAHPNDRDLPTRMYRFLDGQPLRDAYFSIAHGWQHVYNLLKRGA